MANLLLLNGPNLNLLGRREPEHYGVERLEQITTRLQAQAQQLGHSLRCEQSNAEHVLIEQVQQALDLDIDFIIINPAAFTHTSIALRDAFLAVAIPFIEVHLSDITARESFRQISYFSDIALEVISGLGALGYERALIAANDYLKISPNSL
jgi:3-dehydroquinate dehydratase-2